MNLLDEPTLATLVIVREEIAEEEEDEEEEVVVVMVEEEEQPSIVNKCQTYEQNTQGSTDIQIYRYTDIQIYRYTSEIELVGGLTPPRLER